VAKKLALEPVFEVGLVARRRNFFESASYGITLSKDWSAPRQLGVLLLELAQPLHLPRPPVLLVPHRSVDATLSCALPLDMLLVE
jgi:hypothetical protein